MIETLIRGWGPFEKFCIGILLCNLLFGLGTEYGIFNALSIADLPNTRSEQTKHDIGKEDLFGMTKNQIW